MGRLRNETKSKIVALKQAGLSLGAIMKQLNVKQPTIRFVWQKYQLTGSVSNKTVAGRPKN
jgi:transposase